MVYIGKINGYEIVSKRITPYLQATPGHQVSAGGPRALGYLRRRTVLTGEAPHDVAHAIRTLGVPRMEIECPLDRRSRFVARQGVCKKNNPASFRLAGLIKAGDDLLSRWCSIIGAAGLTAEFGMGSGVTPPLCSPAIESKGVSPWIPI